MGKNNTKIFSEYSWKLSFYIWFKNIIDFFLGALGCFFLLPIWLILRIAYWLEADYAPVIYQQTRVGKDGKSFRIFKFRSMVPDAEEKLKKLLYKEPYRSEWDAHQKLSNDPRITRVGKILRQTSFDELPQMINLLLGQMSLVGPRPLVEGELEHHNGDPIYQRIRPGITGWWAVNGRPNVDYEKRLELEYYYIKNISLIFDMKIILMTVRVIFQGTGTE